MKKTIGIVIIIIISIVIAISVGIWLMDIHSDSQQVVTTLQKVAFYSDWKCGLKCGEKNKIGEIPSGARLKVLRIRYGKDYMAIKVIYNREKGWLIYSSDELELKNIVDS
ncbi:MAG: hypothetical protein JXA50_03515 [Deltaproteobacteria bacterium]|nr:hypothetical protein [Deltaproteobacteria bacterium]